MILVECKPDEVLIRALGVPHHRIRHCRGKGQVCRKLERAENTLGLLDEDPGSTQPARIRRQKPEEKLPYGLKIYRMGGNQLVVLCPRLEEWVLEAAREAGLRASDFGLPEGGPDLHRVINERLDRLNRLVKAIQERKSPRLQELAVLVREAGKTA